MLDSGCPLCEADGGEVLWRDADLRVVMPDEPDYPGFVRVIWNDHVREMTDLEPAERNDLIDVVWWVEARMRECLTPEKVNLASLGNVVPHLHWHVIPRFRDDRHFPAPIWAEPIGAGRSSADLARLSVQVETLRRRLRDGPGS